MTLRPVEAALATRAAVEPGAPPADLKHILLLEDDHEVRLVLRTALEQRGYYVTLTPRQADALAIIARIRVDLLISNIVLPDGTSLPVVDLARQKGVPALLMTGSVDHMAQLDTDGDRYLAKPFRVTDFLEQVRAYLE